ncbi:endolytic transglycosylase MltG [Pseudomonas syringae group genomosp. 3]|uniref:endolytic transglycosylase MltG n=1 Tax=Pseudomonas syringae group genomosp. 3 TaxID=251701 RepID=UPI001C82A8FE|nr:endolytic transglycosylase MltG [Pseudomonas syringae group genomosp. 3]MBX6407482.1 endolytic transglycosylase MltG [Pseudomonas syringae pv. tomato]MBX6413384.1 endolytic transglycosylase MltG [Pseudomonas syringae pv. tomato]MBX6432153.1 endolytic transglycosylase MltG [Pseudomonas syringae pv. tomato]MBX6443761.1 endolytic transglycosylase MltG [Pseudomonas syringae pv. tomato]MBX6455143.1 endolytic transglycosylase MltG [Pseudomonas syringae pv. tomato]
MIRKLLVLLETAIVLAVLLLGFAFWQQKEALNQPLKVAQEQLFDVPAGSTPTGVLNRLQADGVIKDAFWLRLYWRFNLSGQPLHSGEYRMLPGMDVNALFDVWKRKEVVQYSLTLVEGWNFRQVRAALAKQAKLDQTLAGLSDSELMAKIGHPDVFPEGRFFPDTYRYVRGMTDAELLKQAYNRLEEVLDEEWQARSSEAPYSNPYQALIMASMVEKETGVPQERGQIAGVFVRRLKLGMQLQTDPTVIYGMGERYNGKLTRANLREPTPYNTYVIAGMPPTPISLVGREAIHAALNPVAGSSLYFVAKGDGSHVFSDDLDAHNSAVRDYQLKRRADYRSSPAPAAAPAPTGEPAADSPASPPEPETAPDAPQSEPDTQ